MSLKALLILIIGFHATNFSVISAKLVKRQTPGSERPLPPVPAEDLLPPPALSSSFPTLRPPPRSQFSRPRPFQNAPVRPAGAPFAQPNSAISTQNNPEYPLLPPLEIPPEKPLSDSEITHVPVQPTSFIPTTGQGVIHHFTLGPPTPSAVAPTLNSQLGENVVSAQSQNVGHELSNPSTNVRFPDSSNVPNQPSTKNCPACECTNEVDYICASNGILYLNSCSFDCATFCDTDLRKVELGFCSAQTQQQK